ncbi:putative two component LuxR family transcriptional regulator [Roseibium sp. TrichSKD4]|uniref:helix-turn-helix transcriptional regulator n=1 Tax=Roseibium sp. TrichSKD4 TaxID=744980 RepID=UPI0001E56B3F|nr:response regulator transcription factor [Roseibium sp. TrichSKD4]EFO31156.1 putative two component LuxR family transcriptional regulator [Roseibium sp. TrichSKD4]
MSQTTLVKNPPLTEGPNERAQHLRKQGATIVALCDGSEQISNQFKDLMDAEAHIFLVYSCPTFEDLLNKVPRVMPDVIVAAYDVMVGSGFQLPKETKLQYPDIKVISSRTPTDGAVARNLFSMNVDAVLGDNASSGEYSVAIRAVGFGGFYVSREISEAMALSKEFPSLRTEVQHQEELVIEDQNVFDNEFGLSQRELEVLHLVAKGLSSKQIAPIVNISARTVEAHRANIKRKTKAMGLSDLVEIAQKYRSATQI